MAYWFNDYTSEPGVSMLTYHQNDDYLLAERIENLCILKKIPYKIEVYHREVCCEQVLYTVKIYYRKLGEDIIDN